MYGAIAGGAMGAMGAGAGAGAAGAGAGAAAGAGGGFWQQLMQMYGGGQGGQGGGQGGFMQALQGMMGGGGGGGGGGMGGMMGGDMVAASRARSAQVAQMLKGMAMSRQGQVAPGALHLGTGNQMPGVDPGPMPGPTPMPQDQTQPVNPAVARAQKTSKAMAARRILMEDARGGGVGGGMSPGFSKVGY